MRRRARGAVDTRVRVGPLELRSPVVAASGTFGHGTEVLRMVDPQRLGAVTVKSLAAFAWPGNPPPRLHATVAGGMLNSVGLQGPGVAAWARDELPALAAAGVPVIVSVWGRSVADFGDAAAALREHAGALAAVEVNVSCPNVEDSARMFAHSATATRDAIGAVVECGLGLPVLAKLSPNTHEVVPVARAAVDAGATALTLVNTLLGYGIDVHARRPLLGRGVGGYSGVPIKPIALRIVHEVAREVRGVPIVGTGGVACGTDGVEMLLAGARAVGIGTATFREPRAVNRVHDEIEDWCRRNGVERVADLTGALEEPATDEEEQ